LGRFAADIEFSAWRGGFPGLVAPLRKAAGIHATPMCRKTGSERIIIIAGMIRNAAATQSASEGGGQMKHERREVPSVRFA